jgi:hypothetical protein
MALTPHRSRFLQETGFLDPGCETVEAAMDLSWRLISIGAVIVVLLLVSAAVILYLAYRGRDD